MNLRLLPITVSLGLSIWPLAVVVGAHLPVDGVQRVPDEFFTNDSAPSAAWKRDCLPLLKKVQGEIVVLLLWTDRNGKGNFLGISVTTTKGSDLFTPGKLEAFHILSSGKRSVDAGRITLARDDIIKLVNKYYAIVADAKPGTQEDNWALGENDILYLFAARVNSEGQKVSRLEMAQAINPPPNGIVQELRQSLEHMAAAASSAKPN